MTYSEIIKLYLKQEMKIYDIKPVIEMSEKNILGSMRCGWILEEGRIYRIKGMEFIVVGSLVINLKHYDPKRTY